MEPDGGSRGDTQWNRPGGENQPRRGGERTFYTEKKQLRVKTGKKEKSSKKNLAPSRGEKLKSLLFGPKGRAQEGRWNGLPHPGFREKTSLEQKPCETDQRRSHREIWQQGSSTHRSERKKSLFFRIRAREARFLMWWKRKERGKKRNAKGAVTNVAGLRTKSGPTPKTGLSAARELVYLWLSVLEILS